MEQDRNDGHFEEVLGRLDSLIRHGQTTPAPPPPPSVSEATIPVLTEIYDPLEMPPANGSPAATVAVEEELSEEARLEQAVAAVLPLLVEVLENELMMTVQPALESALKRVLEGLQPRIETALRQQMQAVLAKEQSEENQTET